MNSKKVFSLYLFISSTSSIFNCYQDGVRNLEYYNNYCKSSTQSKHQYIKNNLQCGHGIIEGI
jgi:hypothetical protein